MNKNTFFTEEQYTNDIDLDINNDVLQRMYADNVDILDELELEFVFITDSSRKAERLKAYLTEAYPAYNKYELEKTDEYWELHGRTNKMQMYLPVINDWNKLLWDDGYKFDCKLDGWIAEV